MEVRIKVRPSGTLNGHYWPEVGEVIDLPDVVAADMLKTKSVELVDAGQEETRPADTSDIQTPGSAPDPAEIVPVVPVVETTTPSAPADTSKVETATPRKGRASAVVNPAADTKPDAGAESSTTPAPTDKA